MPCIKAKNAPNSILAATPLGELTALPQTTSLDLRGPTSMGRGEDGREKAGRA